MINAGYKLLSIYLSFTLLRFFIPIELLFSKNIHFPQIISDKISLICHKYTFYHNISFSIWEIFEIVWIIGALIQIVRLVNSCIHCRRYLILNGTDITGCEPYNETLNRICMEHNKHNNFRLLILDDISTPMIYGIFSPCILMPSDMNLSPNDLYYTLSHEVSHHLHHDLLIKAGINILAIVYWWNPAIYAVRAKSNLLLEMRVDDHITHKDNGTTNDYLRCLIRILEFAADKSPISQNLSLAFVKKDASDLKKRFVMLCNRNTRKMHTLNILLTVFIVAAYMASYVFILEAHSYPDDIYMNEYGQTELFITPDTTYLIENEDGTYSVYFDSPEMPDFYLETIDSFNNNQHDYTIYYLEKGNFK